MYSIKRTREANAAEGAKNTSSLRTPCQAAAPGAREVATQQGVSFGTLATCTSGDPASGYNHKSEYQLNITKKRKKR